MITKYNIESHGIEFKLEFYDRITIIGGKSGVGKSLLFKAIQEEAILKKSSIKCFDFSVLANGGIQSRLKEFTGETILIDNADIILTFEQKLGIASDSRNQYILFAHSVSGFHPTKKGIAELCITGHSGKLIYPLMGKVCNNGSYLA